MSIRHMLWLLFAPVILLGCEGSGEGTDEQNEDVDLEGSWRQIEFIAHDEGSTEWEQRTGDILYEKHLTPTHFTWFSYDIENDVLLGAGGGSYSVEGDKYLENIDFFHPPGSGLLGQAIPFTAEIDENGVWYHLGFAKELEFDPETGDNIVVDTIRIEEKWTRLDGVASDPKMVGTWHLTGYKESTADSTYNVYPDFVGYMKLITPSNFVWIRFNNEESGGDVIGLGSGSWSTAGNQYVENIKVIHPVGSGMIDTSVSFTMTFKGGMWYHHGYTRQIEYGGEGEVVAMDSTLIDEIWIAESKVEEDDDADEDEGEDDM